MPHEVTEVHSVPVLTGLTLTVDGEEIATASPSVTDSWTVRFGGDPKGVSALVVSEEHARFILDWIGERLSPPSPPAVINGPSDRNRAPVGKVYYSKFNKAYYRRRFDGGWDFRDRDSTRFIDVGNPINSAYPLTAVED